MATSRPVVTCFSHPCFLPFVTELMKLRVAQSEVFFHTNSWSGSISDAIDVLSDVNNPHILESLHNTSTTASYSLMLSCNKSVISAL